MEEEKRLKMKNHGLRKIREHYNLDSKLLLQVFVKYPVQILTSEKCTWGSHIEKADYEVSRTLWP